MTTVTAMEMVQGKQSIVLVSSDGQAFPISRDAACRSLTIKNMLEDMAASDGTPVPLANVKARALKQVVTFCEYHLDHPEAESKFVKGGKIDRFSEWDAKFTNDLKEDLWALFETILAANYLDIKPLLEVLCRTVAAMIKGKTPQEVCKMFNIRSDCTEAELEQIKKANPWLDEI